MNRAAPILLLLAACNGPQPAYNAAEQHVRQYGQLPPDLCDETERWIDLYCRAHGLAERDICPVPAALDPRIATLGKLSLRVGGPSPYFVLGGTLLLSPGQLGHERGPGCRECLDRSPAGVAAMCHEVWHVVQEREGVAMPPLRDWAAGRGHLHPFEQDAIAIQRWVLERAGGGL